MIKFHVYDTGQITRTGSLALQARKSTRTTRRSKVKKKLHIQSFIIKLLVFDNTAIRSFICLDWAFGFIWFFVCLFINRSPHPLEAMLADGSENRQSPDSSKYVLNKWSGKFKVWTNHRKKNSCSLRFQSFYFHLFMLWIFLEFFGYSDGENDVIIPHICSVSKAQPCQSPRKVWWNLHSRPGMCGSESKCYCWIMQTEHSWCNLVQGQG